MGFQRNVTGTYYKVEVSFKKKKKNWKGIQGMALGFTSSPWLPSFTLGIWNSFPSAIFQIVCFSLQDFQCLNLFLGWFSFPFLIKVSEIYIVTDRVEVKTSGN